MSRLGPEHARIQALLSAYLDGEVSSPEKSAVEEHLAGCNLCTQELRTLRQTVELLHALPAVAPRRSFTLHHLPVEERSSWWAWSFPYLRSATAAALALFLLVVSGDFAVRQLGFAPSPAAPSLAREAPAPPADAEGEPAAPEEATVGVAPELPAEVFAPAGEPEETAPAERAREEEAADLAAAPVSEAAETPAEPPSEELAVGEAEAATPIPAATTPAPEAATPAAESTTPVPAPPPPEPGPVAPDPEAAPVVARQTVLLSLLRWAEVALVAILIPLGLGTLVAWRISRRAAR